jgi:hypothetical protein
MALALLGAILAQILLSRRHDAQMGRYVNVRSL